MSAVRKLSQRTLAPKSPPIRKMPTSNITDGSISVFTKQTIYVIALKDILYFKSDSNYTRIVLIDGSVRIASRTLKVYESKLNGGFLRVHHSSLINPSYIKSFSLNSNELSMSGNTVIPVSRTRKPMLISYLKSL